MLFLRKENFLAIDGAFLVLKEDPTSQAALKIIEQNLHDTFNYDFEVRVINESSDKELFVMSVFPEVSVIDKIISSVSSGNDFKAIQELWKTNKKWTIEIDGRLFKNNIILCTEKELTAMLLHEVGHIVSSTSIPNRISTILQYEITKCSMANKAMAKDKIFRRILSLPILDACISDAKRTPNSIKEEIKADDFVRKMGYTKELQSVLNKLSKNIKYPKDKTINDKIKATAAFSMQTLDEFQQRHDAIAKNSLFRLKESCTSPYIKNILSDYIETVFEDAGDDSSFHDGKKLNYMHERADKLIQDTYLTEFFIGKKELKRIDPAEIDYIRVKINSMKYESDRMMILSYIHSKIDLVDYHLDILLDDKMSKKYNSSQSYQQLMAIKKTLLQYRLDAINFKLPDRTKGVLVAWPEGYEG